MYRPTQPVGNPYLRHLKVLPVRRFDGVKPMSVEELSPEELREAADAKEAAQAESEPDPPTASEQRMEIIRLLEEVLNNVR